MADYSITAANVLQSSGATIVTGIAGATITQGQVLYKDTADSNKLKLADANGSATIRLVAGIAVSAASPGQPVSYITKDPQFTPGYTIGAGEVPMLASDTPGASAPDSDATTGDFVTVLGIGIGSDKINVTGFALASLTVAHA